VPYRFAVLEQPEENRRHEGHVEGARPLQEHRPSSGTVRFTNREVLHRVSLDQKGIHRSTPCPLCIPSMNSSPREGIGAPNSPGQRTAPWAHSLQAPTTRSGEWPRTFRTAVSSSLDPAEQHNGQRSPQKKRESAAASIPDLVTPARHTPPCPCGAVTGAAKGGFTQVWSRQQ